MDSYTSSEMCMIDKINRLDSSITLTAVNWNQDSYSREQMSPPRRSFLETESLFGKDLGLGVVTHIIMMGVWSILYPRIMRGVKSLASWLGVTSQLAGGVDIPSSAQEDGPKFGSREFFYFIHCIPRTLTRPSQSQIDSISVSFCARQGI